MNFYQTLFQTMTPGVDYNLTVSRTATDMSVLLMPKVAGLNDPGAGHIVPFIISGQPQEIDAEFFGRLTNPLQQAVGVLCNMERFRQSADEAAANSKSAKAQKDQDAMDAKAKKEKFDKYNKQADEHEVAGKLQEAVTSLQQARLHGTDKEVKKTDEKIAELKSGLSQGSLFGDVPVVPPVEAVQEKTKKPAPIHTEPAPVAGAAPSAVPQGPGAPPAGYPPNYYPGYQGQYPYGVWGVQPGQPSPGAQPFPGYEPGQPYPPGHPQASNYAGYRAPQFGAVYNPEDYAGMPDVEATHVGNAATVK